MVMLQRWSLMEGEWSCYRGGQFNGGEWSLQRWPVYLTFKSHLPLHQNMRGEREDYAWPKIEKEWSCYGGCHFNGRENGHVTEVVTLMEGEWSYYRGGQFNGGRIVMLQRWPV